MEKIKSLIKEKESNLKRLKLRQENRNKKKKMKIISFFNYLISQI